MKKILSLILSLGFVLSLSACDMGKTVSEMKSDMSKPSEPSVTSSDKASNLTGALTREEAIQIALNHAGFMQTDVLNLTAELDKELTHSEWEIEFDKDNYEYSYEIDAYSGDIIKSEKEND